MRRFLIVPLVLAFLSFLPSQGRATNCSDAANGTDETLSYLFSSEFADGQPAGSITPGCMRDVIASLGPGGGNIGMEIDFFVSGSPASSMVLAKTFSRRTVVAAGAPIHCTSIVGATGATVVTLEDVVSGSPTSIGTVTFAASGSAYEGCSVSFSSAVTFSVGDSLEAVFPSTPDATAANISISIPATQ